MKLPLGNSKGAQALIVLFIILLLFGLSRCHAAQPQLDFGMGASITHGPGAGMAELDYRFPIGFTGSDAPYAWVGTTLLGAQQGNPNSWAWHTGIEGGRGPWRIGIGFAYLARVDGLNGQNANFTLTTGWVFQRFFWWQHQWELRYRHFSDAGTSAINQGRDMVLVLIQLQ